MLIVRGITECPRCKKKVCLTQDLFIVKNLVGTEKIPGFVPGAYHYECFRMVHFRDRYLALKSKVSRENLEKRADSWRILGADQRFALVHKILADQFTIYFFSAGRDVTFDTVNALEDSVNWMLNVRSDIDLATSPNGLVRMLFTQNDVRIGFKEEVFADLELDQTDFRILLKKLGIRNPEEMHSKSYNFDKTLGELGIAPKNVECLVKGLSGIVERIDVGEQSQNVVINILARKWKTVILDYWAFEKFKEFLALIKEKLKRLD